MLNYIALYPNEFEKDFNDSFLLGSDDVPIEDFVITAMKEFEAVENIEILETKVVRDQDEIDLNKHTININYKKKNLADIEIPKYKFVDDGRYGEVIFKIRVSTNINQEIITKRILIPIKHDGYFISHNKKMKDIWQLVDASTYNQRGKITIKSRMPIVIYHNKHREVTDVNKDIFVLPSYSYALNSKSKRPGSKVRTKFINPLMLYAAKMGMTDTIDFFGMKGIVSLVSEYKDSDLEENYIFPLDEIFIKADKVLFDKYEMVKSFVSMCYNLACRDFPVEKNLLNDNEYWICRIGYIGSVKNKNIISFKEKGFTTIYMVERLLDQTTINNLRLPEIYKHNIYFLLYWFITNWTELKKRSNMDMNNKRIRRNEYIVNSSLGKKVNENLNKLIEKKSKSKLNTMDTLLELFNFNSDIIIAGMRNLNDLIKTDDIVNDMDMLQMMSYSAKGPNSLAESNSKMLATKYRYLDPSMVGKVDINVSSNTDVGTSGMFTPFVKLYNKYYFTPEKEPCDARYNFDKSLENEEHMPRVLNVKDFDTYLDDLKNKTDFVKKLKYEPIRIVEKVD